MSNLGWTFTKTQHTTPYPALSPRQPALSQAGKTVVIAGGTAGIGLAIARAFRQASASRVILLGRDPARVATAAAELAAEEEPAAAAAATEIIGRAVDIADATAVQALWEGFRRDDGIVVDVLVLNAAAVSEARSVLDIGAARLWAREFDVNVRAQLDMVERFYKQADKPVGRPLYLVHVSTLAIHDWNTSRRRGYGISKMAGATALQAIAIETPPDALQVVNFHPGPNFTQAAKDSGYSLDDDIPWQDINLAGQFAVWLASPEARFLHGRFVWASWDVDELKSEEMRKRLDEDELFLKTGVKGL